MFNTIKILLCAMSLLLLQSCKQQPIANDKANTPSNDTHAIQNIASEFISAWNRHDAQAVANLWTVDGDFLSPWSPAKLIKGRAAIEKYFADEYQDTMKDASMKLTISNIRLIDPETAFTDAEFTVTGMSVSGVQAAQFNNHAVFILLKQDGKWEIQVARPF